MRLRIPRDRRGRQPEKLRRRQELLRASGWTLFSWLCERDHV